MCQKPKGADQRRWIGLVLQGGEGEHGAEGGVLEWERSGVRHIEVDVAQAALGCKRPAVSI